MPSSPPRLLGVGIATLDYVYAVPVLPTEGVKYRASQVVLSGGGLTGNSCTQVARLGGDVTFVTRLGDDPTGDTIMDTLTREGMDCRHVRRFAGHNSPVSAVMVDAAGERMIVSYSDSSVPTDASWLPESLLDGVDFVIGDTRWAEGALEIFTRAKARNIPSLLDGDRKPDNDSIVLLASHVAFGATGLAEWTGIDNRIKAMHEARRMSPHNVLAVTGGGEGVWFFNGDELVHSPGFPVKAIDTLSAGDSWHGAFAFAVAEGQSLPQAVRFASAAAAIKCTVFGGRAGMPRRDQVEQLLANSA